MKLYIYRERERERVSERERDRDTFRESKRNMRFGLLDCSSFLSVPYDMHIDGHPFLSGRGWGPTFMLSRQPSMQPPFLSEPGM